MAADVPFGFLSLLFGRHAALEGQWVSVWEKREKRTAFFRIPDQLPTAAAYAETLSAASDVYFGVCPYLEPAKEGRGTAEGAGALVGLWLDVDVYHAGAHAKKDLPPTREAAFDLVYELPNQPPSKVISSGYGLQAWWLFREPFLIRDEASRLEAAKMAKGWVDLWSRRAKAHGWTLDPVGDLARILRLPGTKNHKQAGDARPVEVVSK